MQKKPEINVYRVKQRFANGGHDVPEDKIISRYKKALDLLPLVGSSADIFRTNTFHILGSYIWSPYLLITIPVMIGICCTPLTVKNWSRRLKA